MFEPKKISKERAAELQNQFKWYPLGIGLPESTDLHFYGCQVNPSIVMLTAVYNSDICTLCTTVEGCIVECEGKYFLDTSIENTKVTFSLPKPEILLEEKEVGTIVDGDKMTIREAELEKEKRTKEMTDDEYANEVMGFNVNKTIDDLLKEESKPKEGNIDSLRLANINNSAEREEMINYNEQQIKSIDELIDEETDPRTKELQSMINQNKAEAIERAGATKKDYKRINDEVILTKGKGEPKVEKQTETKSKSSFFINPKKAPEKPNNKPVEQPKRNISKGTNPPKQQDFKPLPNPNDDFII